MTAKKRRNGTCVRDENKQSDSNNNNKSIDNDNDVANTAENKINRCGKSVAQPEFEDAAKVTELELQQLRFESNQQEDALDVNLRSADVDGVVVDADNSASPRRSQFDLVPYEALPPFLHDNEFLLHGHRPELNSFRECFKSIFRLHTETWNIWTHLLGAIVSVVFGIHFVMYVPAVDWTHQLVFIIFFLGSVFCLGASATYHAFICHSERACKALAKLDYCGVIILISTSAMPWIHFVFYCHYDIALTYMLMMVLFASVAIAFATKDEFREPQYRWIRLGVFMGVACTSVFPAIHYVIGPPQNIAFLDLPVGWLLVMGLVYLIGGVLYGIRVPERISPGTFDITCQSHQLLHVCVLYGIVTCYQGATSLAAIRLSRDCAT